MFSIDNIQVSEGSVTEPVILQEAKDWLMVDHDDHDDLLTSMITGAREDIEQELNVKLVASTISFHVTTSTNTEQLSQFPWVLNKIDAGDPVVSELVDGEADELLVVDEDYYYNGTLKLGEGTYAVEVEVDPTVPTGLQEAIKMLVAYRYNNRGDQEKQHGLPEDIERKISKYRQIWL